jgi:flagellar motor switch protein FliN/FliY
MPKDRIADAAQAQIWLNRALSEQISQVLESMTGEAPLVESSPTDAPPEGWRWWSVPLSKPGASAVALGASDSAWNRIGRLILTATGLQADGESTIKDTFREAVDQAWSGFARSLTAQLSMEVTSSPSVELGQAPALACWTQIEVVFSDTTSAFLVVGFPEALLQALTEQPAESGSSVARVAVAPAAAAAPEDRGVYEVLLDVELPVSVSFGRAHLPLKEVLKLSTGSIVELNRRVSEPVEVIVNNCVIARGEVVVVEGNFGVRIQQVVSRQERLRTLH